MKSFQPWVITEWKTRPWTISLHGTKESSTSLPKQNIYNTFTKERVMMLFENKHNKKEDMAVE